MKRSNLKKNNLLFLNRYGKKYASGHSLNQTLKKFCKRVGIEIRKNEKLCLHSFRHEYVTKVIKQGNIVTA